MLTDVFIRRPVLSTVLALLIILAGAISIPLLPVERYPQITPPSVTVTCFYTGANAQAVESAVTTPLEQVINGVEGMTYLTSSSTNSGASTITVYFEVGPDQAYIADIGSNDVRSEGMSYGMFIAVQMDMQQQFDQLWRFAKTFMQYQTTDPLTSWHNYFRWRGTVNAANANDWAVTFGATDAPPVHAHALPIPPCVQIGIVDRDAEFVSERLVCVAQARAPPRFLKQA